MRKAEYSLELFAKGNKLLLKFHYLFKREMILNTVACKIAK